MELACGLYPVAGLIEYFTGHALLAGLSCALFATRECPFEHSTILALFFVYPANHEHLTLAIFHNCKIDEGGLRLRSLFVHMAKAIPLPQGIQALLAKLCVVARALPPYTSCMRGSRERGSLYVRNIIFGIEDSLVSTVGVLSGIAATTDTKTVVLVGTIYITVEAFSMAVGSFLSEEFTEEYVARRLVSLRNPLVAGIVMFLASIVAGCIPLLPYLFFDELSAFTVSIVSAVLLLFVVGAVNGRIAKVGAVRGGLRLAIVGGLAILLGLGVGQLTAA